MHSGFFRLTLVLLTLALLSGGTASIADAQQTNTTSSPASGIAPLPSDATLQSPNSTYPSAPVLGATPQVQPLRTPQDQAAFVARQQQAMQQAAPSNGQQMPPQQMMQQQTTPPQLVPVTPGVPQASAQDPVAAAVSQASSPATVTSSETSTSTTTTEPAAAAQVDQTGRPTTTTGFTTKAAGNRNDSLPLNNTSNPAFAAGAVPVRTTNPGIDMSIDPSVVGATGQQLDANGNPVSTVPYEVQLQQRTQELQAQARDIAYEQAKKSVLPMESYEIKDVLGRLKDTQEAIQTPVRPAPTPNNTIETISTDPSAVPKVIQLAAGNVTTLNIVDITGEPWPIVDLGFGGAFDVKPPEAGGHVVRITPLKDFARGNLVIRLLKMTTPITFSLQAGGDTVNYRFDARIPDYGPNAKMPLMGGGIETVAGDKITTAFLEGVPPKGADKLAVGGVDGRTSAYKYAGTLYVRTPLTLISPAWQGSATSADGLNVYYLNDAPVLLLSDKGSLVRARISDAKKEATGF